MREELKAENEQFICFLFKAINKNFVILQFSTKYLQLMPICFSCGFKVRLKNSQIELGYFFLEDKKRISP